MATTRRAGQRSGRHWGPSPSGSPLAGGLTFGAGLQHLLDSPDLYGVGWDVEIPLAEEGLAERVGEDIEDAAAIEGVAVGATGVGVDVEGDDRGLALVGLDPIDGDVMPPALEGRLPEDPDEIALGADAMDRLEVDVGDSIEARLRDDESAEPGSLEVVGRTVLPRTSLGAGLGEGGLVTVEGLAELGGLPEGSFLSLFVNAPDGVDPDELVAVIEQGPCIQETAFFECPVASTIRYPPPPDVDNFGRPPPFPR